MNQQIMHLRPGEHGGQFVVILGFDLGENGPVMVAEHLDKEDFGAGHGLADVPTRLAPSALYDVLVHFV